MDGVAQKTPGAGLNGPGTRRFRLQVSGVVQGVGFRPFVYRLAAELGLSGFVRNTACGVEIEVQSSEQGDLERFVTALDSGAPPLAKIVSLVTSEIPPADDEGFAIHSSAAGADVETVVPPDIALCDDCRRELLDPDDRRYRYPFINCTNCGPRYTITEAIPYDRPQTTMNSFVMCERCNSEYRDPADRRFHAQPNACPVCGPELQLLDTGGNVIAAEDPVTAAARLLRNGNVVAVKGLGGFHLAVDACNEEAVAMLRRRKGREEKPFAVMAADFAAAERVAYLDDEEREALLSPEAPIVLLLKRNGGILASSVAPGNPRIGILMPYTPLHVLLMREGFPFLVMTSANASEEPMTTSNEEALGTLREIADAFLLHNRPIHVSCDDSVTICLDGSLRQVRRSRGYVPAPLQLTSDGDSVLGVGAEIKNTVCALKRSQGFVSHHIGDLKNYEAYRHFQQTIDHLLGLFRVKPDLLVCDMHPAYLSAQWARQQKDLAVHEVQHHHAHLVSCLAENGVDGPAVGLILDGSGYGVDGTVWGGEVLVGDAAGFERYASLEPLPLPGGDSAVFHPWKSAAGYLDHAGCSCSGFKVFDGRPVDTVLEMVRRSIHCPLTSSCGRLFDAVAAICNIRADISYEGQAAVELTSAAGRLAGKPFSYDCDSSGNGAVRLLVSPMISEIAHAVGQDRSTTEISRRFHVTIVKMFSDIAGKACAAYGLNTVALSGGVFQNPLLFEGLVRELRAKGFDVLTHRLVPCNDGGISLGQAVIGRQWLKISPK
ncbi:carbamoyltransferase HypF [Prosthecochloris sp. N3]|uniref:Carbamoyltransferase n=1 Tax=Prosthecochloris ethylica TaxID=2743976 RepID=A0ABR9XTE7_9CHLB|nr:carbamoyltransferase HypF [Prosthecochloris ethylica]MBF0587172.1 carbamoyltransferase HypF [Prosthecochloris ethylica]MBF0637250.1 carbamoyltransferase HypF [Prosthecochloris ethylica]NUK48441.1 carbamoyltransferase HypF [Prosthecochloris ethylica]